MKFGNILFTGWLLAYVHAESGAERAEILQDNEDFWHRFVKHQDSLATAVPSTSGGTPRKFPMDHGLSHGPIDLTVELLLIHFTSVLPSSSI